MTCHTFSMLRRLEVEGLALLSDVQLVLHPGLNVITGETGAGKSLLMGALACLMGARAGTEKIRGDGGAARVEAEFELSEPLPRELHEMVGAGLRFSVRRTLRRTGRGECSVAGRPVSVQQMGQLVRQLIAFNGQNAAYEELSSAGFIDVLDGLASRERGSGRAEAGAREQEKATPREASPEPAIAESIENMKIGSAQPVPQNKKAKRSSQSSVVRGRKVPVRKAERFRKSQLATPTPDSQVPGAAVSSGAALCGSAARALEELEGVAMDGRDMGSILAEYRDIYLSLRQVRSEAQRLFIEREQATVRKPLLTDWLASFESLEPRAGEVAKLEQQIGLARGARHFLELARRVQDTLSEREGSVEEELRTLVHAVSRGNDVQPFAAVAEALREALVVLNRAGDECRRITERLELDPAELESMENRLHELIRLSRRIGVAPSELAETRRALQEELELAEQLESAYAAASVEVERLTRKAVERAELLHESRSRWAAELERRITQELRALCIEGARIEIRLTRRERSDLDGRGFTSAELLFSANPGEPLARLDRVASGGERSRVLLALRSAGVLGAGSTMVFDEIDAGVGGAAAAAVGERLRHIATARQVLCVTHQASVAAQAQAHFHVAKHVKEGRTETLVARLGEPERVAEIARMLAGDQRPAAARELASALLRSAGARVAAVRAA
ncbi:MAG TPA: AAA family ATPase [Polyangiaceae bacterium]|nr:AAA family ATPase [Polyangiaceae bacterium]